MKVMPRSKNGPRSNFSMLPFPLRFRIIGMIHDGCTAEAIGSDPEVSAAFAKLGSTFNRATLTRVKKSREYKEITARRSAGQHAAYQDRLTAAILSENASIDTIAERTKVELLKAMSDLSDLSELSDEEKVKALQTLSRSVTAISDQSKDNTIAELRQKLSDWKSRYAAAEKEHQLREAELMAENRLLNEQLSALKEQLPGVDTGMVARAMDEKFGV